MTFLNKDTDQQQDRADGNGGVSDVPRGKSLQSENAIELEIDPVNDTFGSKYSIDLVSQTSTNDPGNGPSLQSGELIGAEVVHHETGEHEKRQHDKQDSTHRGRQPAAQAEGDANVLGADYSKEIADHVDHLAVGLNGIDESNYQGFCDLIDDDDYGRQNERGEQVPSTVLLSGLLNGHNALLKNSYKPVGTSIKVVSIPVSAAHRSARALTPHVSVA